MTVNICSVNIQSIQKARTVNGNIPSVAVMKAYSFSELQTRVSFPSRHSSLFRLKVPFYSRASQHFQSCSVVEFEKVNRVNPNWSFLQMHMSFSESVMLKRTKLHQISQIRIQIWIWGSKADDAENFPSVFCVFDLCLTGDGACLAAITILLIIDFNFMCCVEDQQHAHLVKVCVLYASIIQTFTLVD